MNNNRYHWIPDQKDARDVFYTSTAGAKKPAKVDLRKSCSPVENQGALGSCTAHALAGNMEYFEKEEGALKTLSRLFIYYNERNLEGDPEVDRGARLRDGLKALKKWGVCPEKLWPYRESLVFERPDDKAFEAALPRRISAYKRLSNLDDMKDCLAGGQPFVFGFVVYPSFESPEVAKTGRAALPSPEEKPLGGHAVLCVGYDDEERRIIARNSWGREWGENGYFTLPYEYLSAGLADDFWTITI